MTDNQQQMSNNDKENKPTANKRTLTTIQGRIEGRIINEDCLPFRLFQLAKKYGIWDPVAIDLRQDQQDWSKLNPATQEWLLRTLLSFLGGEEAVTLELLPLTTAIAATGHLEETMYLTTFLVDEAKHVEFFARYLKEVVRPTHNIFSLNLSADFQKVVFEELHLALDRLNHDHAPEALAIASTTYHLLVEGILGQFSFKSLKKNLGKKGLMPGLMQGITHIQMDESRHISYGTFLLQRLIAENAQIMTVVEKRVQELLPHCLAMFHSVDQASILQTMETRLKILQY